MMAGSTIHARVLTGTTGPFTLVGNYGADRGLRVIRDSSPINGRPYRKIRTPLVETGLREVSNLLNSVRRGRWGPGISPRSRAGIKKRAPIGEMHLSGKPTSVTAAVPVGGRFPALGLRGACPRSVGSHWNCSSDRDARFRPIRRAAR